MKKPSIFVFLLIFCTAAFAQTDWIRTGTGLGVEKVRLAVPEFKPAGADPQTAALVKTFNDTLWSDLDNAGIFEMVSKSFYPLQQPSNPAEMREPDWANPPASASMVAFGNLGVQSGQAVMQGWLFDVKNSGSPQVLGKEYRDATTEQGARKMAHKFADDIIFRLGGGIAGIAESTIAFVSTRSGHKEIWEMDYDGANQTQVTHLGSISLSPRLSPDGTRLAFTSFGKGGMELRMFSLDLNRPIYFISFGGTNLSPAWASDGTRLAFSSSMHGNPNIYVSAADGSGSHRVTEGAGPDVSPVWNPKTNAQIAYVSGKTGEPQIYIMDADGTNVQAMTDTGYAVSPSWSPNGQFLTFAWRRTYGPGAPGNQDIYIMDVASKQWVQLTHDSGVNDFPSWSPDGRHIVYESKQGGKTEIWSMLADGSKPQMLTSSGNNQQPNWSFK